MDQSIVTKFWPKVEKGPGCWEWIASKIKGHGRLCHRRKTLYAHRISYELHNGPITEGMVIDHICRNKGCVNPEHLRMVTSRENSENREGASRNSKSGIRGVYWREDAKQWLVTIHARPKTHYVGYFRELADAEAAAIAKRNELFTHNDSDRTAA